MNPDTNSAADQILSALRKAVRLSPENLPLRRHFAQNLVQFGHFKEAEGELRALLLASPDDPALKFDLSNTFYRLGKHNQALVLLEELLELSPTPTARMLQARVLFSTGDLAQAAEAYKEAVEDDPSLADDELSSRLRIPRLQKVSNEEENEFLIPNEKQVEPRPRVTFEDVGGMEDLKEEIRIKIIHPLTHPDLFRAYGKKTGGGILMYGPPGCGKTFLARATAGEAKAAFISVGIHEVLEMWVGQSERNLHSIFEQARRRQPCILFFDEVDALGASRVDMRQSANRQAINQFLAEMDGLQADNEGLLILAATNAPWHVDSAFRRPGRFDRVLFVPPPDSTARSNILRALCKGKPLGDVNFDEVASKTTDFSGADLKALVDLAVEAKLRMAMKHGTIEPLATKDLLNAARQLKPTTREWFQTARNYALYANQSGLYDDILKFLGL